MRAVVGSALGGPEVLALAERDIAGPGPGQLLVEVRAAGVNFMDVYQREGRAPYGGAVPFVPGAEGAGVVLAAGDGGTDGFATGDLVAWASAPGSYAERVLVPADRAVRVPDGVDPLVAAAVLLQGMTAHYLCHDTYPVRPGEVVVVHAAAGGVGLLLTQMAKMRGGVVVATVSAGKEELARAAGADHVAGYGDFGAVVREVTGGAGAAAVYDGVGQATFEDGLASLRHRGMMVLYGAASGPVPPLDLQRLAGAGSLFVTRPTLVHYVETRADLQRRAADLFRWIQAGGLSVRIGGTYPLADAARAHTDLQSRGTTGKLLLLP